jgi:hypothetical protein
MSALLCALQKRALGCAERRPCTAPAQDLARWVEALAALRTACRHAATPTSAQCAGSICASPDGALYCVTQGDRSCRLLNATTGDLVRALEGHEARPVAVTFHPVRRGRRMVGAFAWRA